jgi:integrase
MFETTTTTPLSNTQVRQLLGALASDVTRPDAHDVAVLATETNARWGELTQLRWDDINFKDRTVRLSGRKGSRVVHASTVVLEVLARRKECSRSIAADTEQSGRVFTDRSDCVVDQAVRRIKRTAVRLGMPAVRLQDLRCHFAVAKLQSPHDIPARPTRSRGKRYKSPGITTLIQRAVSALALRLRTI